MQHRTTQMSGLRLSGFVLAAVSLSLAAPPVLAQIEEVTVTAQKREESLQEVSLAVSAFDGDFIRNNDIAQISELATRTPGMVYTAFSIGQPEIGIRGISTKEDGAGASDAVIVSVDGIYIAARTAQVFDIFDLERVEVLRGPQSTLYGKNTVAGAINFVTARPTEDTVVRLRQTIGDYGRFDTAGLLSGQVAEQWFAKFSFSRREHDGYLRNILEEWVDPNSGFVIQNPEYGKRQGESNTFNWRAHLRYEPTEDLDWTLMVDGADDSWGATNREPIGSLGPLHDCGCASDPIAVNEALGGAGDLHSTLAETAGYTEREVLGASLVANYRMDFATSTTSLSYRDSEFDWVEDSEGLPPFAPWIDLTGASGSPGPLLTAPADRGFTFDITNSAIEDARQYTLESRLVSPGGEFFDWLAGIFWSNEEIDRREGFNFPTLGGTGPNANSNWYSLQYNDGDSWAAFGQGTWNLTDRWSLTAGGRYSDDQKDFVASSVKISGPGLLLVEQFEDVASSDSWDNFSWRLAADFRASEDILLYGSISTGYKAGGFIGSPSTVEAATTPFDEETAINYEIGFKGDLLDRHLRLNVAAFFMDIEDLQVTRFFQPLGNNFGEFLTENAGEAESQGVELELIYQPTAALQLGGSYAYLDATYTDFQGAPSLEPDGSIIEGADFNGNQMRQSPEHSFNVYAHLTHEADWGLVWARLDYRYQDEFFFDPSNSPISASPSYSIWDARIAYETLDGHWQFSLWGKNLGDEQYLAHLFTQRGGRISFGLPGDPRTYGVSIEYNF